MGAARIGLALGSGSARGWAHIGVIRALEEEGIKPGIVCGSSIGSLVGGAYAADCLDALEGWVRALSVWDVVRLLDVRLAGGLIDGKTLMDSIKGQISGLNIEQLDIPYGAVATDLGNGREIWLQKGDLLQAIRASIALPGLFSPHLLNDRWLVDGGLTNPVPVSLCRAMGAEVIIAVNLNSDILGKHLKPRKAKARQPSLQQDILGQLLSRLNNELGEKALAVLRGNEDAALEVPGLFEVVASSINIMQDRITKSRMAGDPPDVLLSPRLGELALLEFDRADEAIEEGYDCVKRSMSAIRYAAGKN
jgi:NTE family protein